MINQQSSINNHQSNKEVLLPSNRKSFAEVLSSMPNVGRDDDFERIEDEHEEDHVLG